MTQTSQDRKERSASKYITLARGISQSLHFVKSERCSQLVFRWNTFQERNGETVGGHQDVSASRSFGRKQERDGVTQYRLYLFRHRQGRSEASFH